MEIRLANTSKIVLLNGIPARLWEGQTASGIAIHAFITRIGVDKKDDLQEFEKELQSEIAPSADVESYPLRLLI